MKVQGTAVSLTVQIFMGLCCLQKEELVVCVLPPADGNRLCYTHFTLKKKKIKSPHTSLVFHRYFQVFHCF